MPRTPQIDLGAVRRALSGAEQMTAAELAETLNVSRPTISRALRDLGEDVVRFGAARTARYTLRRSCGPWGNSWPIYRVSENGEVEHYATLDCIQRGFRLSRVPDFLQRDFPEGFFEGQPFFFIDLQPQGFLGRIEARRSAATIGVPADPRDWTADDILGYLVSHGSDLPGNWVVGDAMVNQVRAAGAAVSAIDAAERTQRYPELAERAIQGETFGSSAAGEQPKFAAWVRDPGDVVRAVLVKFSSATTTQVGRRWADLLRAEYHSLQALRAAGYVVPAAMLLDAGNRVFLEVTRFDRIGVRGRRGILSLHAAEIGFVRGAINHWVDAARSMEERGQLDAQNARLLRRLWCFGRLIGNTDMHNGNVSFVWEDALPLTLAPVYDMLPMLFAPSAQGELVVRPYSIGTRSPELDPDWLAAAPWALDFCNRILNDAQCSEEFRALVQGLRDRIGEFAALTPPPPTLRPTSVPVVGLNAPELVRALQLQKKKSDAGVVPGRDRSQLQAEIAALLKGDSDLRPLASLIFPEGLEPTSLAAFARDTYFYLGVGDNERVLMGKFAADVMSDWKPAQREEFLRLLIADRQNIFEALDIAQEILLRQSFACGFMREWLAQARAYVGRDLYQRGFWNSVRAYATRNPADALQLVATWLGEKPDEDERIVIARLLGWARAFHPPGLDSIESRLRLAGRADWRSLYLESWLQVEGGVLVSEADVREMYGTFATEGPEELAAWCHLVASRIQSDPAARGWGHRALAAVASPSLHAAARYWIMVAAESGSGDQDSGVSSEAWEELLISALPTQPKENGLWNRLNNFLRDMLRQHSSRVLPFLTRAVQSGNEQLLQQVTGSSFDSFVNGVRDQGLSIDLSTHLCLGKSSGERRLGLSLFQRTHAERLDPEQVEKATTRQLELLLRETQLRVHDAATLGRIHGSLAPRLDAAEADLKSDFYRELQVQAHNSLIFRQSLGTVAVRVPTVAELLRSVDELFSQLAASAASPAVKMQVPHYFRAEQLFDRRFSREVEESANEHSIFAKMVRHVRLLYGDNWRAMKSEGTLTPTTGLHPMSTSIELPRMELIDPEGMALRRFEAARRLKELEAEA